MACPNSRDGFPFAVFNEAQGQLKSVTLCPGLTLSLAPSSSPSLSPFLSPSPSLPLSLPPPPPLFVLYLFLSLSLSLSPGGDAWLVTTRWPRARCGARRATICRVGACRRAAARGESPSAGRVARARRAANHHPPAVALRERHAGRVGACRRAAASCASPPAGRGPPSAEHTMS